MHVLVKFFARPGFDEAVIEAATSALTIRRPTSTPRGRAILCQRDGAPGEIIYLAPVDETADIERRLADMAPDLNPLLARPLDVRWCKDGFSFRRWGVETSAMGVVVIRVSSDLRDQVIRRCEERGREYQERYPGMVAYRLLLDLDDGGFIALENEWKTPEGLAHFRTAGSHQLVKWVVGELGGQIRRYEYHVRAVAEPAPPTGGAEIPSDAVGRFPRS